MPTPNPLPKTMHAVRVHGPGDLRVDRVPLPELGDGDALLRVRAAGVCATDRKLAARGAPLAARGAPGAGPRVLGHEIVAEVVVPGASRLAPGTRVAVAPNVGDGTCPACRRGATNLCPEFRAFGIHLDGGMAGYLRVPRAAVEAGHLLVLPDALSDLDAALLEPLACCVEGLLASDLHPGDALLIVAAGVMGRLHVVAARALGAGTIVVVDRNEARLAHARALGADVTLGPDDDLADAIAAATGGRGVDVAAVTVGSTAAASAALEALAREGRLNLFGGFGADQAPLEIDPNAFHYRGLKLLGTTGASLTTLARTLALLAGGRLDAHRHGERDLRPGGRRAGLRRRRPGRPRPRRAAPRRRTRRERRPAARRRRRHRRHQGGAVRRRGAPARQRQRAHPPASPRARRGRAGPARRWSTRSTRRSAARSPTPAPPATTSPPWRSTARWRASCSSTTPAPRSAPSTRGSTPAATRTSPRCARTPSASSSSAAATRPTRRARSSSGGCANAPTTSAGRGRWSCRAPTSPAASAA